MNLIRSCCFVIFVLCSLAFVPARAETQENLTLEVKVGFDAFYKVDNIWVPAQVMVANQGPDLRAELRVRDEYYQTDALYRYPIDLPSQSRKQFAIDIPLRSQRLELELVDDHGDRLLSKQINLEPLNDSSFLVGVIASDPSLLNALAGLSTSSGDRVAVAHLELEDLPTTPQAWAALDMLVFNDVDTMQLSSAQQAALVRWVNLGGRLVIGGGPKAAQTIAGLQALLPFAGITLETLPHPLTGLENFVRTPLPDRGPYVAAIPTDATTDIFLWEGQWPLIISLERGLGQIHYLALDLGLAPLDTLAGQRRFMPRLVGRLDPDSGHFSERANWRELRTSLALIPDQTLPTPQMVAIFLLAYVIVVGPVNYILLRRLKRREWAWFTLPVIVLLFCGYGYASGFRLRGGQPLLRQIVVLQAEPNSSLADINAFIGVYSPYRTHYTLEIEAPALVESFASDGTTAELNVVAGDSTIIKNLQADVGSMPGIFARSHTAPPLIFANLSYGKTNHRIQGTIANNTGQPISLAFLIVENQALELGTLPAGETRVDGTASPRYAYNSFYDTTGLTANTPEALELASRDIALRAALGLNNYSNGGLDVKGLYLTGWQPGSPLNVKLVGQDSDRMDETLLLVGLAFTRS